MTYPDILAASPALLLIFTFILGLVIGSFLNVVIHRLPLMLEQEWLADMADGTTENSPPPTKLTLATPRSRCPHCGTPIRPIHNIPLLGFILLRGHCPDCGTRISRRYPAVELFTGLISVVVALRFGVSAQLLPALVLSWGLIALAVIDLQHHLLPDSLTLPLLWLGLLLSIPGLFSHPTDSIIGAAAGYTILWSLYHAFRLLTGKEGMGYGDFKLLAVFGAWFGWQNLPLVLLLSSVVGSAVAISLLASRRITREVPIPFGPYLAGAGWLTMMAGGTIVRAYWHFSGLG